MLLRCFLLSTCSKCDWCKKIEATVVVDVRSDVDTLNRGPLQFIRGEQTVASVRGLNTDSAALEVNSRDRKRIKGDKLLRVKSDDFCRFAD